MLTLSVNLKILKSPLRVFLIRLDEMIYLLIVEDAALLDRPVYSGLRYTLRDSLVRARGNRGIRVVGE